MRQETILTPALTAMALMAGGSFAAHAQEQDAIDGCIDPLRAVGGPDGAGGEVISSEFSHPVTLDSKLARLAFGARMQDRRAPILTG
jgi:hypothetical protein